MNSSSFYVTRCRCLFISPSFPHSAELKSTNCLLFIAVSILPFYASTSSSSDANATHYTHYMMPMLTSATRDRPKRRRRSTTKQKTRKSSREALLRQQWKSHFELSSLVIPFSSSTLLFRLHTCDLDSYYSARAGRTLGRSEMLFVVKQSYNLCDCWRAQLSPQLFFHVQVSLRDIYTNNLYITHQHNTLALLSSTFSAFIFWRFSRELFHTEADKALILPRETKPHGIYRQPKKCYTFRSTFTHTRRRDSRARTMKIL